MKKILFVANMKKDKDLFYSKKILLNIVEKKVKVFVDTTELIFSDKIELVSKKTLKEIDLMLVLGGDGTVLTNARKYEKYDIPIVCINLGRVGALAVAELDDYETYVDKYLNDDFVIIDHLTLECEIAYANGKNKKFIAFNDVVVHRGSSPKILITQIFLKYILMV